MKLIENFLKRRKSENIVFQNHKIKIVEQGGNYKFVKKKDKKFSLELMNGETYDIHGGETFSKDYLINNNAVLLDSLESVVHCFGENSPDESFKIKLTKDQLSFINRFMINEQDYFSESNFSLLDSESDNKITMVINGFPKNKLNIKIGFKERYPTIKLTDRLDNKEGCDISNINPYTVVLNIPSIIKGKCNIEGFVRGKKLSEISGEEFHLETVKRIDGFNKMEELVHDWNNKSISVKIDPYNYTVCRKEFKLEKGKNELVFTNDDFKKLCELELDFNISQKIDIKVRYKNKDVVTGISRKKVNRINDTQFKVENILPGEQINIYYIDNYKDLVDTNITSIPPLKPGEHRKEYIDINIKKKRVSIDILNDDKVIVSVNNKARQVEDEDELIMELEESVIEIKNTNGEVLSSKEMSKSEIKNLDVIRIEEDSTYFV